MKDYLLRWVQMLLPIVALALFVIFIINYWTLSFWKDKMYQDIRKIPNIEVGLVFGASVKTNLEPSTILKDRLHVAADAYALWKIQKIIVSWDNSQKYYNEPVAMQKYLIWLWVDERHIFLDYAWFDTYDSIYRAKHIFGVDKIVLFTQDFQLKRAMYISERLWLETYWIYTNLHIYENEDYNNRREIFARVKAYLDVEVNHSKPKFLWPLIDMTKPQMR